VRGEADTYTLVGDAKAFRLSRTARNQKDFKVAALDDWRSGNTYACLVAPLYQFPSRVSQIYRQALTKNVTLLAYVHLKFLLDYAPSVSLEPLWQIALHQSPTAEARAYWQRLKATLLALTRQTSAVLERYKQRDLQVALQIGQEAIQYWQGVIHGYQQLTREEAIARLRNAEKVDQKIQAIEKTLQHIQMRL
jgi:type II restriction enzyme